MFRIHICLIATIFVCAMSSLGAFSPAAQVRTNHRHDVRGPISSRMRPIQMSETKPEEEVVELVDEEIKQPDIASEREKMVAPFISQGELADDVLNPDLSDPKQTRVIIYTILSLLPVLFLIPLMIGRELIPLDALPPVEINY